MAASGVRWTGGQMRDANDRARSVLPCDISQWRDRFSSGRGSIDTDSLKRAGSLRSLDMITDDENDDHAEDEVF